LAKDYDGAILLQVVSGAELNFLPAPFRGLVRVTGWVFQYPIIAALSVLFLLLGLGGGSGLMEALEVPPIRSTA
jgi:hypothetical protein